MAAKGLDGRWLHFQTLFPTKPRQTTETLRGCQHFALESSGKTWWGSVGHDIGAFHVQQNTRADPPTNLCPIGVAFPPHAEQMPPDRRLQVTGYRLRATGCGLQAAGYRLRV